MVLLISNQLKKSCNKRLGQYSQRPWWSYIYRFKRSHRASTSSFQSRREEIFEAAQAIRSEYVLEVWIVKKRLDGTDNPEMSTGKIEIVAKDLTILNTSKTTPLKSMMRPLMKT